MGESREPQPPRVRIVSQPDELEERLRLIIWTKLCESRIVTDTGNQLALLLASGQEKHAAAKKLVMDILVQKYRHIMGEIVNQLAVDFEEELL